MKLLRSLCHMKKRNRLLRDNSDIQSFVMLNPKQLNKISTFLDRSRGSALEIRMASGLRN